MKKLIPTIAFTSALIASIAAFHVLVIPLVIGIILGLVVGI